MISIVHLFVLNLSWLSLKLSSSAFGCETGKLQWSVGAHLFLWLNLASFLD